jgi:glucuronoarabinoxylan endo-1,4-beta-xylanase
MRIALFRSALFYSVFALILHGLSLRSVAQTATINGSVTYQTIDGWGASTGFNERNNNLNSAEADCFFSTSNGACSGNSIGLEWVRIQDNATPNSAPDLSTLQLAVARGAQVNLGFNPPSGLNSGNYASTASYDVAKIQYLQSNGVSISAVSPINEPLNTSTSAVEIDTFIASYLYPAMVSAGLSSIPIIAPEGGYWFRDDYITACMNDSNCGPHISIVAGHAYWTGAGSQGMDGFQNGYNCCVDYAAKPLPSSTSGKKIWQTEVNGGANGPCPDDTDIGIYDGSMNPDALTYAHNIHDFLTVVGGSAWFYWNLAAETANGTPAPGCNDGLTDEHFNPAKRFYAIGNYSKFMRSGQVRISATANPQSNVYISAAKDPNTGAFEIVAINRNSGSVSQTFNITGLSAASVIPYITDPNNNLATQTAISVSGNSFTATLAGTSVTTFVTSSSGPGAPSNLTGVIQ